MPILDSTYIVVYAYDIIYLANFDNSFHLQHFLHYYFMHLVKS